MSKCSAQNKTQISASIVTTKSNSNMGEVKVDFGNDSNCREILLEPENADPNLPLDENEDKPSNKLAPTRDETTDSNKSLQKIPPMTVRLLISLMSPIVSHVFDFVSDIRLAINYFENQKTAYTSLTLAFTILQAVTAAWISSLMHAKKSENDSTDGLDLKDLRAGVSLSLGGLLYAGIEYRIQFFVAKIRFAQVGLPAEKKEHWLIKTTKLVASYTTAIVYQMALPRCHLHNLWYAWKLRRSQQMKNEDDENRYHRKMLREDGDLAVLKVMECFLQSAPQLILQLFILITQDTPINTQMWSKIVSGSLTLYNLGLAMKTYHCATRLAQPDKAVIGEPGDVLLFLWHFGTIAARIFLIAIAASNWLLFTLFACLINWIGCTFWIYAQEKGVSSFRRNKADSSPDSQTVTENISNWILASVFAIVYMFTFVNLGKGPTFVRNSVYYILCLMENGAVVVFWSIFCDTTIKLIWVSKALVIFSVTLFFIGIGAMATYYMFFHPTLPSLSCSRRNATCVEDGAQK